MCLQRVIRVTWGWTLHISAGLVLNKAPGSPVGMPGTMAELRHKGCKLLLCPCVGRQVHVYEGTHWVMLGKAWRRRQTD